MSMEKYGVSDRKMLQEGELRQVKARLRELRNSHEKTAAETQEAERLEIRAAELKASISAQEQEVTDQ
jgi:hypothetical protein